MPAQRVTTLTVPVDGRRGVVLDAYRTRTPLVTIMAVRPALLVTLTLPEQIEPGHVRFARDPGLDRREVRVRGRARLPRLALPRYPVHLTRDGPGQ